MDAVSLDAMFKARFRAWCDRAREVWPPFITPDFRMEMTGQAAGRASWRPSVDGTRSYTCDFNRVYGLSNAADMLEETIPHEVAHCLVWQRYGRDARPHGAEWHAMFGALTGRVASRTHDYGDVKVAARKAAGAALGELE